MGNSSSKANIVVRKTATYGGGRSKVQLPNKRRGVNIVVGAGQARRSDEHVIVAVGQTHLEDAVFVRLRHFIVW